MKTILLILAVLINLSFGQTSTEFFLIGEWSTCGRIDLLKVKDITLNKKSSKEIESTCTINQCSYISLNFENNESGKPFSAVSHKGCKNELANAEEKIIGWSWTISKDNKRLTLTDSKLNYNFLIVSITSSQLTLKKI